MSNDRTFQGERPRNANPTGKRKKKKVLNGINLESIVLNNSWKFRMNIEKLLRELSSTQNFPTSFEQRAHALFFKEETFPTQKKRVIEVLAMGIIAPVVGSGLAQKMKWMWKTKAGDGASLLDQWWTRLIINGNNINQATDINHIFITYFWLVAIDLKVLTVDGILKKEILLDGEHLHIIQILNEMTKRRICVSCQRILTAHRTGHPFNILPQRLAVYQTACRLQDGLSEFENKSTGSQKNKSCMLQESNVLIILLYMNYMKLHRTGCCRISTWEQITSFYICIWNSIEDSNRMLSRIITS